MHTVVGWLVEFRSVIKSATADCDEVDTVAEGYSVTNVTASMWVSGDKRLLFINKERERDRYRYRYSNNAIAKNQ